MFDFLSQQEIETFRHELLLRQVFAAMVLMVVFMMILVIGLMPGVIAIENKKNLLAREAEELKVEESKLETEKAKVLNEKIYLLSHKGISTAKLTQEIKDKIGSNGEVVSFSTRIEGVPVDEKKPEGEKKEIVAVSFSGVANDRKALLSIKEIFEGEERYSGVDIPLSSFTQEEDIEFSLQFYVEDAI